MQNALQFDTDPEEALYAEAVKIIQELGHESTSTLQRRLRIGYGRAVFFLDRMETEGILEKCADKESPARRIVRKQHARRSY